MSEREPLTVDQAIALLPDRGRIHTVRNSHAGIHLGADWDREDILAHLARYPCEKAGPMATASGHGLWIDDGQGRGLWVETMADE